MPPSCARTSSGPKSSAAQRDKERAQAPPAAKAKEEEMWESGLRLLEKRRTGRREADASGEGRVRRR